MKKFVGLGISKPHNILQHKSDSEHFAPLITFPRGAGCKIQLIDRIILAGNLFGNKMQITQLFSLNQYFSKLFKKETGKSVGEYILLQKMEMAKQLLISTKLSVAEITDRIGFESQSSFTARFRETTGTTPREYRSTYQNGNTDKR